MDEPTRTFEVKIAQSVMAVLRDAFRDHPELRSVSCTFDYHGELNQGCKIFVWIDDKGYSPPRDAAVIAASIRRAAETAGAMTKQLEHVCRPAE